MHQSAHTDARHAILDPTPISPNRLVGLLCRFARYVALALVMLSVLLPTLSLARSDREKENTTHVRGITQGLIVCAQDYKGHMPGTDSKGNILPNDQQSTGLSGHGATVEARFWVLLDNNNISGEYAISPAETKTAWTTGKVSTDNYSYAMLNIHSNPELPEDKQTRPDQRGRAREWKDTINTQAVLVTDRARIKDGHIGEDYDRIYSLHSTEEQPGWIGSVGRGDGSAMFVLSDKQNTKYGSAVRISNDRLFAKEQDPAPNTDVLENPDFTWHNDANALLGYQSVGYEDNDIASD